MSRKLTIDELATLETLIDRCGLAPVMDALVLICDEKAAHLTQNWNDKSGAKIWMRAARTIEHAVTKPAISEEF